MTANQGDRRVEALRLELEQIDRDLIHAVSRRQRLVETLANVKQQAGIELRDRIQETAVLARSESMARELGADPFLVGRLFREVIAHAVRVQEARALERDPSPTGRVIRVGYQGADGAYSHLAARRHFSFRRADTTYQAFATFKEVARAVAEGEVDSGVLPIENSTAGSINETYDLLSIMELSIIGEEIVTIEHCLIGVELCAPPALRRIYSHPQALAQCSTFLAALPDCEAVPFGNTALAVEKIARDKDPQQGAIASEEAAERHGLVVLARDVANERVNLTRFVVIGRQPLECALRVPCKTSIVFVVRHERGSLVQCLNALADHGLNLSKLESRPRSGSRWEYQFYVDFDGNVDDPAVQDALADLERRTLQVRVLGCYPSRTHVDTRVERVPGRKGA
jgi:chorismate mutase/prephenate dehydratase